VSTVPDGTFDPGTDDEGLRRSRRRALERMALGTETKRLNREDEHVPQTFLRTGWE
jgi:hypothetical protein